MKRENRSYFFQIEGGTCCTIRESNSSVALPKIFSETRTRKMLHATGTARGQET